jgi:hypothetical protein
MSTDAFRTQNASSKSVTSDIAARFCGATVKKLFFSFEKTAADSDGSVFRVGRISPYAKIVGVKIACDAITSLTDVDIGFYKPLEVGGDAIDADCLKDGLDPHAGISTLTEEYAPDPANVGKEAYLIAGVDAADAHKYGSFDIALTGNTAGTDTGSIAGIVEYVE